MGRRKTNSLKTFNKEASSYDAKGVTCAKRTSCVIDEVCREPFNSILDIGCGTGTWLSKIDTVGVEKVGLDISVEMIKKAKEKLCGTSDLCVADSEALPWLSDSFDVVISTFSFHHYENPQKILAEMCRVIKKNGRIIIYDLFEEFPFNIIWNFRFNFMSGGDVHVYSQKEMVNLLTESGFGNIVWKIVDKHSFMVTAIMIK
jgi:ubiquinone/menaquinone biosynthesis C-methylase UbiE